MWHANKYTSSMSKQRQRGGYFLLLIFFADLYVFTLLPCFGNHAMNGRQKFPHLQRAGVHSFFIKRWTVSS